jgi:hypothetical protein
MAGRMSGNPRRNPMHPTVAENANLRAGPVQYARQPARIGHPNSSTGYSYWTDGPEAGGDSGVGNVTRVAVGLLVVGVFIGIGAAVGSGVVSKVSGK